MLGSMLAQAASGVDSERMVEDQLLARLANLLQKRRSKQKRC